MLIAWELVSALSRTALSSYPNCAFSAIVDSFLISHKSTSSWTRSMRAIALIKAATSLISVWDTLDKFSVFQHETNQHRSCVSRSKRQRGRIPRSATVRWCPKVQCHFGQLRTDRGMPNARTIHDHTYVLTTLL